MSYCGGVPLIKLSKTIAGLKHHARALHLSFCERFAWHELSDHMVKLEGPKQVPVEEGWRHVEDSVAGQYPKCSQPLKASAACRHSRP